MRTVGILLDIRSLHNVGSMFRTADGAGIEELCLCGITPQPLDRFGRLQKEFAKTALGSEMSVKWRYEKSVIKLIHTLKKEGYTIYAVEQTENSKQYNKLLKSEKRKANAFIVGNEVSGVPLHVIAQCDTTLEIPMNGTKESLNVSVAFGIIAYELKN